MVSVEPLENAGSFHSKLQDLLISNVCAKLHGNVTGVKCLVVVRNGL